MNEDPLKEKLDEIHQDVKGGFRTLHDRADRENTERHYMMERIVAMWQTVEQTIKTLFRRGT